MRLNKRVIEGKNADTDGSSKDRLIIKNKRVALEAVQTFNNVSDACGIANNCRVKR